MFPQGKYRLANASGIPWLVNWCNRNRLLVLTYHGIYDGPHQKDILPDTFVHVDDMVNQLRAIKHKYHVIDSDDLFSIIKSSSSLPQNTALITFDDGYESFYRLAAPVLDSLELKALVFIPTYYIERQKPFWFDLAWLYIKQSQPEQIIWLLDAFGLEYHKINGSISPSLLINKMKKMLPEARGEIIDKMENNMSVTSESNGLNKLFYPMRSEQVRELAERGTTFGGHTHTHTILTVMPDSLAESEILENKNKLEDLLLRPCHFFAYPNGGHEDYNDTHKMIVKRVGYQAAFSLTQRRSFVFEDIMNISRINVVPEDTVTSLLFRCTGAMSIVTLLRRYGKME